MRDVSRILPAYDDITLNSYNTIDIFLMNHHHHHIYNEAAEPLGDDDILRGMCMVYVMRMN